MTRGWRSSRLSSGSTSRLVSMLVPARVRSTYGDMTKAAAGSGSPGSRALTRGADQRGDGEAAAGGLSREGDVRRGDAVVQKGFIGRKSIVNRCRIRVLGSEPVVDGDDLGARPPTDLRGQASCEEGAQHH